MAYRYSGRSGVNLENEQRRLQREPLSVWKKQWVLPTGANGNKDVKVLKWVKTGESIKFDQLHEEEHLIGEETMLAMEVDQARPSVALSTTAEDTNASTPAAAALVAAVAAEPEGETTPQLGDRMTAVANSDSKPLTPAYDSSAAHTPVNISAAPPAQAAIPITSMLDTPPVDDGSVERSALDALPRASLTASHDISETNSAVPPLVGSSIVDQEELVKQESALRPEDEATVEQ